MQLKLDTKSLIAGLLLGAAAVVTIASSLKPSGPVGRFQTTINDNGSVVMTDTVTGQAWQGVFTSPASLSEDFMKPKNQ